jgi:hypothetical protein
MSLGPVPQHYVAHRFNCEFCGALLEVSFYPALGLRRAASAFFGADARGWFRRVSLAGLAVSAALVMRGSLEWGLALIACSVIWVYELSVLWNDYMYARAILVELDAGVDPFPSASSSFVDKVLGALDTRTLYHFVGINEHIIGAPPSMKRILDKRLHFYPRQTT